MNSFNGSDRRHKLIVISGSSGGGKSTLITELREMGYAVFHEVATEIVREQKAENGDITPWQNPNTFCQLLLARSIENFHRAKAMADVLEKVIFFDRSYLEGIQYFKTLSTTATTQYDYLINDLRYCDTVYIAPPWEEIFCQDEERKHSFEKSVDNYKKVVSFYLKCGYKTKELPKVDVKDRVQFMLSSIRDDPTDF